MYRHCHDRIDVAQWPSRVIGLCENAYLEGGNDAPDYVATGVLIVLIVWAVADWVPRGKL